MKCVRRRDGSRVPGYIVPIVDLVLFENQPLMNNETTIIAHSAVTTCGFLFPEGTLMELVSPGLKRRFWSRTCTGCEV